MLDYLVTSKARRRLLMLLWGELRRGAVDQLADAAAVSFASAHGELKAMEQARLVVTTREHGKDVYFANLDHPAARSLQDLVAHEVSREPESEADDELKASLVGLGAPLRGFRAKQVEPGDRLSVVVRGLGLARRDAVVARTLPVCLWRMRDELDLGALEKLVVRPEDKHALGFFLELTGELGSDRRLAGLAEAFRDRRMTSTRPFFFSTSTKRAPRTEFPLAEKWGFAMNTDLDSFRSLFHKFVRT